MGDGETEHLEELRGCLKKRAVRRGIEAARLAEPLAEDPVDVRERAELGDALEAVGVADNERVRGRAWVRRDEANVLERLHAPLRGGVGRGHLASVGADGVRLDRARELFGEARGLRSELRPLETRVVHRGWVAPHGCVRPPRTKVAYGLPAPPERDQGDTVLDSTPPPDSTERTTGDGPARANSPLDLAAELYTYAAFGACMGATLPFVAASHLRHRGEVPRYPGRWVRRLARVAVSVTPLWQFAIEGEAPEDIHDRAYVVVANHLSMADPFLLSSLPWDMQWVAKEALFKVPLVGWILRLGGDIALRRGSGDSVRAMLDECRRALDGGLSVMLFPEGTRAMTPGVQRFKDGAFELAIEKHVPLLPVAVAGTSSCMQKGSSRLGRANAIARILAPVETASMTGDDMPSLRDGTRDRIIVATRELEAKLHARARE